MIGRGSHRPTDGTFRGTMAKKRTGPSQRIGRAPRRDVAATKSVRIRLTPDEYDLVIAVAKEAGGVSNLIRKGLAGVVPGWPAPTTRY